MSSILTIDDSIVLCMSMEASLKGLGHSSNYATSINKALSYAERHQPDIIFLDVNLQEGSGINYIPKLLSISPDSSIIMLSGESDSDVISVAFAAGAKDYLLKPVTHARLEQVVRQLIRQRESEPEALSIAREEIVGTSPALISSLKKLALACKARGNVLITGETGTGKELFARALHNNSDRAGNRYIVVDCTNLPNSLAESLLFGHDKGSFTGADQKKKGLFHLADGGTLFLDEIGDLDLNTQKSLLRVLQEKKFRPLSSSEEVYSDFRLVAATNCDLKEMVKKGTFRQDLYYRVQAFTIELPPLRERNGDIEQLAKHYVNAICREQRVTPKEMDKDFVETLEKHNWPGNVRELVNVLQVAIHKALYDNRLNYYHLPQEMRLNRAMQDAEERSGPNDASQQALNLDDIFVTTCTPGQFPDMKCVRQEAMNTIEQQYLRKLVDASCASVAMACQLSGLSRARLYELLQKHNLSLRSS